MVKKAQVRSASKSGQLSNGDAADIQSAFPGLEGFSANNVWRMRAFYPAYLEKAELLAPAVQVLPPAENLAIPWTHNVVIVQKIKDHKTRLLYARMTAEHGWSRDILALQIDSRAHGCHGKGVTNFENRMPKNLRGALPTIKEIEKELSK